MSTMSVSMFLHRFRVNTLSLCIRQGRRLFLTRSASTYNIDEDELYLEDQIEADLEDPDPEFKKKKNMTLEHRAFLKQKIIETKLAKLHGKPKMPNLLTWAARAQITYLHKEDPIYWTPEVLADSFPATPAVIKEILRRPKYPRDELDIVQHDQRVFRNWQQLKQSMAVEGGGPMDPVYRLQVAGVKLGLMKNAAGARGLPMPDLRDILPTRASIAASRMSHVEPVFTSLLNPGSEEITNSTGNTEMTREEASKAEMHKFTLKDPKAVQLLTEIAEMNETGWGNSSESASGKSVTFKAELDQSSDKYKQTFKRNNFETLSDKRLERGELDTPSVKRNYKKKRHIQNLGADNDLITLSARRKHYYSLRYGNENNSNMNSAEDNQTFKRREFETQSDRRSEDSKFDTPDNGSTHRFKYSLEKANKSFDRVQNREKYEMNLSKEMNSREKSSAREKTGRSQRSDDSNFEFFSEKDLEVNEEDDNQESKTLSFSDLSPKRKESMEKFKSSYESYKKNQESYKKNQELYKKSVSSLKKSRTRVFDDSSLNESYSLADKVPRRDRSLDRTSYDPGREEDDLSQQPLPGNLDDILLLENNVQSQRSARRISRKGRQKADTV